MAFLDELIKDTDEHHLTKMLISFGKGEIPKEAREYLAKLEAAESTQALLAYHNAIELTQEILRKQEEDEKTKILNELKINILNYISKTIRNRESLLIEKERRSKLYNVASGIFFVISVFSNFSGNTIPFISFITQPIAHATNFLGYWTWHKALENDIYASRLENRMVESELKNIRGFNKASSYLGIAGVAAIVTAAVIPVTAPVALAIGFTAFMASNIMLARSSYLDMKREIKHSRHDSARNARIAGHVTNTLYGISNTLTMALLATAAIVALAFPPTAIAIAGAFAVAGLVTAAISGASFISSKISFYVASKKEKAELKKVHPTPLHSPESKIPTPSEKATKKQEKHIVHPFLIKYSKTNKKEEPPHKPPPKSKP